MYLCIYLPVYLCKYLFIHLSISTSICLSLYPSIYLFIYLSVCLSISQHGKLRDMRKDIWQILTRDSKCRSVQPVSLCSGFLTDKNRGNITTAAKSYPFATEPQHDFNLSPDRSEFEILGMILDVFWPIQATLVVREPLCDDVGTPSWALITLFRVIYLK